MAHPTVIPRFDSLDTETKAYSNISDFSIYNSGDGDITISNSKSETLTVASGNNLSLSRNDERLIDYLSVDCSASTETIIYYQ